MLWRCLRERRGQLVDLGLRDDLVPAAAALLADSNPPHQGRKCFIARPWRRIDKAFRGHQWGAWIADLDIDARIINVDTAEILVAAEGKGASSRSGLTLGGAGGNWWGGGNGNVDFGSSNFQSTIIGEATKKAVDALAADLGTQSGHLTVRAVKVDALVAAVDSGQVILNAGARAGIHPGDQLTVLRVGREIKDPATGQVIRRLTSTIGTIQAADVDDTSSVCNVVSGSGFQVGDHAVTPGTSPGAGGPSAASPTSYTSPTQAEPSAATQFSAQAAPQAATPTGGGQPNFTAIKAEFVPGDKLILFDDFSDMAGDEPPPHWKIRGGVAELRQAGNLRELAVSGGDSYLTPNVDTVPRNFTLDFDIFFNQHWEAASWHFAEKSGRKVLFFALRRNYGNLSIDLRGPNNESIYESGALKVDFNQPHHIAYWVQEGRLRMYVDGQRLCDVNQIQFADMSAPQLELENIKDKGAFIGLRNVRLAESAPDFGKTILSTGKYVTHGILFDTDSDTLKPESAAVIQLIARALQQSADLNVEIDGHTDSTGNPKHNQDLSKRRAEAVKSVLVSQFNIDAGRLTTAGFGSSKPIDNNNTAAGKANNRRVEFVRK